MATRLLNRTLFLYLPLWACTLFIAFPLYWTLVTAFKTEAEVVSRDISYFPAQLTVDNFVTVWKSVGFSVYFRNSMLVSVITVLICLVFSTMVGYALSRFRFRGRKAFLLLLLGTQFIPGAMLLIPLFMIFKSLGLTGQLSSLIITYVTFNLPFSSILMSGFVSNIPQQLEEAAMVDGCSRLSAIVHVIFPLLVPGIVATSVFAFIDAWNDFLFALMFISKNANFTIPVGLSYMIGEFNIAYGALAAGSVIALLPTVIFFGFIQKYLVSGIMSGSVKG